MTDVEAEAVPLTGVVAYYDHYWNDKWSSSIGYSYTEVDNTNFQDPATFQKGEYASVNLLYYPAENLMIGGELLWGQRTNNDGADGRRHALPVHRQVQLRHQALMPHEQKDTIMKTINRNSLAAGLVATLSLALAAPAYAKGPLPDPAVKDFQRLVDAAYAKYKGLQDGKNADYIPILTETPSDLFGVVIVTKDGKVYSAGDVDYQFSIQSVSKPFTAALVMTQQGPAVLKEKIGVEPTGMAFNSKLALAIYENSVNPLVNAGAIAAVSLVQAKSEADRWNQVSQNLSDFAGTPADRAREGVRVGVHHGLRQSRHRQPALQLGSALQRARGGAAGLHARVLRRRQRQGPRHDGRDAGQRRRQSADEEAGDAGEARAGAAGDHGDGRVL